MATYVINRNAQPNGDHEVHNTTTGCAYMPSADNQVDLGFHLTCQGAVDEAKRRWPENQVNGCYWCAGACHSG